jgi:hypothetical protein
MKDQLPSPSEVTEALAKAERKHKTPPRARAVVEQTRPPEEAPRAEAQRAPEGKRLTRNRRQGEDAFYINPKIVPNGMSYEWKRESVYGLKDNDHQIGLRENHWRPVPASRHPGMVLDPKDGAIRKSGMVLMERPSYLTEEARHEDLQNAIAQVQSAPANIRRTPDGTLTRDHESVRAITKVKRSHSPIDIPE